MLQPFTKFWKKGSAWGGGSLKKHIITKCLSRCRRITAELTAESTPDPCNFYCNAHHNVHWNVHSNVHCQGRHLQGRMRNVSPRRVVAIRRHAAFGGTAPITPRSFSRNSGHAPRPIHRT
jgi:hypothetical protein